MKKLLVSLLAAVLLILPSVGQTIEPFPVETVRLISVYDNKICSAVVIAPDFALTARHCLARNLKVDSVVVDYAIAAVPENQDIAVLNAPGLACPCAKVADRRPDVGDKVFTVGFVGEKDWALESASAAVQGIETPARLAPWMQVPGFSDQTYILTDKVIIQAGQSGGGMFSIQDGEWKLVGINAVGVPASPGDVKEQASGAVPVEIANKFLSFLKGIRG